MGTVLVFTDPAPVHTTHVIDPGRMYFQRTPPGLQLISLGLENTCVWELGWSHISSESPSGVRDTPPQSRLSGSPVEHHSLPETPTLYPELLHSLQWLQTTRPPTTVHMHVPVCTHAWTHRHTLVVAMLLACAAPLVGDRAAGHTQAAGCSWPGRPAADG